jgi:hypothetical protein
VIRYALLFAVLGVACTTSSVSEDDVEQQLAVLVRAMGVAGNAASFSVSIANVSSQTLKITSVTVNPGVMRDMYGIPVTTPFTLEPGQERTILAEMRLIPHGLPDWPDQVAVDVAFEWNGKRQGHTFHIDVQPMR